MDRAKLFAARRVTALQHFSLGISDPIENWPARTLWVAAARGATIGIFLLLFGATLYFAKTLIAPVISAVVVSTMLGPLSALAIRYRIPPVVFAVGCVAAIVIMLYVMIALIGGAATNIADKAADISAALKSKAQVLEQPVAALRQFQDWMAAALGGLSAPLRLDLSANTFIGPVVEFLTPALGEIILFFATLFFLLASQNTHRRFVVLLFESQDARLRVLRIINDI